MACASSQWYGSLVVLAFLKKSLSNSIKFGVNQPSDPIDITCDGFQQVIYEDNKKDRTQDATLGDTTSYLSPGWWSAIY